ncbi:hypothetical protein [Edaphosphingomonas haloaromaticamans]|uniref:Uncharacterized protein n=1 Tax=Edaphosphingomonas haloaromaticamans TaxID=653954 RepID=A0A1S1HJI1_9SPHN|nr:hypothetical protein [Sphingomonas haloaromaticamans]OHT20690.1 hypothetical protein BHE75_02690 [Sphingomonas haloaromaticamans]
MANKKSAAYAPRWISYAQQILAGLNDGTRSSESDKTTYRIIARIVQTLAKGNALSDKQRTAFVESIRVRLGKPDFIWVGAIKLTRSQLVPAREFAAGLGLKARNMTPCTLAWPIWRD